MKTFVALLVLVLLVSCSAMQLSPVEALLSAKWTGDTITVAMSSGILVFSAPKSSASPLLTTEVNVVEKDGEWFIWQNGMGPQLFLK